MHRFVFIFLLLVVGCHVAAQTPQLPSAFSDGELEAGALAYLKVAKKGARYSPEVMMQAAEFFGYLAGYVDARTDGPNPDPTLVKCVRRKSIAEIAQRAAMLIADPAREKSESTRFEIGFSAIVACKDEMWKPRTTASAAATWQKFAENERLVAFYQPSAIGSGDTKTIWVMFDYKAEQQSPQSGRRYLSQKGQQELDCAQGRSRTVFFTWHAGRMGEGPVVYTGSIARPWEPNSPGGIATALAAIQCTHR